MKVSSEKSDNCQVVLTIESEAGEMDESLEEAYRHLVKKVSVPGFRKGKAPREILVQHIGRQNLLEEALEHLMPELYRQAIESEELEPVARPEIELVQTEPLVFKATVSLRPEVKLGDYHSIRLEPAPAVEVAEEEVAAALEGIRERHGSWAPVDRPVDPGDLVIMDVEASVDGNPWLDRTGIPYEVDPESRSPVPGFASQLQGTEKDKEIVFSLTIPDDYQIEEMRGQEAAFKVTVTEIKEKDLPELTDELAQSAGYENLADMKEKVAADLKSQAEARNRSELRQKALEAVVEASEVSYPPVLEDEEITGLLRDEAQRLGFAELQEYLNRSSKTEDELREQLRPIARKRLTQGLVLEKLAEEEQIEVTSSELDDRIGEISGGAEDKEKAAQFFSMPQIRQSMEQSLRTQKTLDRLLEIAIGEAEATRKEE